VAGDVLRRVFIPRTAHDPIRVHEWIELARLSDAPSAVLVAARHLYLAPSAGIHAVLVVQGIGHTEPIVVEDRRIREVVRV